MCATLLWYNPRMPRQRHYYGLNHLHFITASTYRRTRLFDSDLSPRRLVTSADQWPWSSSYYLEDSSVLAMDRLN
ncbi:MAG TPA: hypothetical protein VGX94_05235 [Terriglobia bacterium]|nr:hypothetical protein [Terriglobia bacterium]